MKRIISIILILALSFCLSACGGSKTEEKSKSAKLSIVTTIFPEYDWVMNILGDKAEGWDVRMLLDSGVDLHSFQPGVDDIITISECDLFVYVGGESDSWVADALKEATNKDMIILDLMELLGSDVKEEELVEGMEAEEEEGEGEIEYDEHIWLSLRNATRLVSAIESAIEKIDSENAESYRSNAAAYTLKLGALDGEYKKAVESANKRTLLFADRFPFRYLTDDYGLDYFAAFVGCSAESEASFETVMFLASKVDELGLRSVLTLEGSDHRIAETVIAATEGGNTEILAMDSMQSITREDVEQGADYLKLMEKNLAVLTTALQ